MHLLEKAAPKTVRLSMRLITLYVPLPYLEQLDKLVESKFYPNRSEAIRFAIHDLLMSEREQN